METETPEEVKARLELEGHCRGIGRTIGAACPPGTGFVLMMFDFGGKGSFSYVSNGNRDDIVKLLAEARDKIRGS